jgi:hypothetical protein
MEMIDSKIAVPVHHELLPERVGVDYFFFKATTRRSKEKGIQIDGFFRINPTGST